MSSERTREEEPEEGALRGFGLLVSAEKGVTTHLLREAGETVLGRDEACDVHVDDGSVSRRHASIHAGDPPAIEDLGSRNGTRVLGRRLERGERAPLGIGSVVELGSATVLVQRASQLLRVRRPIAPPAGAPSDAIVHDTTMLRLYQMLDVIAPSGLSVLVLGETGVGKEVFAHAVHRRSQRVDFPFVPLNCGALTESLLESELFGHEKGAFTGAQSAKVGLFEAADKGTVFLDEIGDLPMAIQVKLLRVLDSGEVLRVGSVKPRRVDVRIVSATNHDLLARVQEGRFRSDLYYRVNGVVVTLPPLRKRPDDILPIAEAFVARAREKASAPPVALSTAASERLRAHDWPGNIRELRNVVERAALLCRGAAIAPADLLLDAPLAEAITPPAASPVVEAHAPATNAPVAEGPLRGLRDQVEELERTRIRDALERCAGNQGRAAKLLGISRGALLMKLDAYRIERPRKGRGK